MKQLHNSIGIVIPNRNDSQHLTECINSLIPQKKYIKQVIFVDDNSTDNSVEIAKKLLKNFNDYKIIKLKKQLGPMGVLNEGIKYQKSEFISFLASNDFCHKDFIKESYIALNSISYVPGILTAMCNKLETDSIKIHNSPILSFRTKYYNAQECDKFTLKLGNWITGSTTLFNKNLLKKIGGFNLEYYGLSDLLTSIHLSSHSGALFIPFPYGYMRMHKGGFLEGTITSPKKMHEIIKNIKLDNKSEIFKSRKFKKITVERIIYSSIMSGTEYANFKPYISKYKYFFIKLIPKSLGKKYQQVLFFIILRGYDLFSFFYYRYLLHLIYRFLK